jgi:eukaryotic-like serine/threonine-protein kinase
MGDRPSATPGANADRGRRRWHFAGTVFDERTLELLVNGTEVELERKPLEVLLYLLEHAGEVCTKDELLAGVWPGRILSETVLTKCIGRLREILGDRDQQIIKTVYGFGYRLIIPVRVELGSTPEPARLDLTPGGHPPDRPLWSLVERLGIGEHDETWRARHEKTHEQRVFKFALDEASLGTLKREITLFRIINDSLAERARIVRLLDWNLERLPYFTEAEYIEGGSLIDWAKSRGGLAAIALPERLEVVAKIASALAAVHSVGVLHKDLKPSNIFVKRVAGQPVEIALGDFGSGSVFDPGHLERLGITRLGFTKTVAVSAQNSVSPYWAPETLAGEPFTVKADIYALGVILYQVLTEDFYKALLPGWERDVGDELLREDLALAAEENPALRLADAEVLARRLRTRDERRAQLETKREAQARAQDTQRRLARARGRYLSVAVALAALIIGSAVSARFYLKERHAQESARIAAAQSEAVTEFLSNELFAPGHTGVDAAKQLTAADLLTRAGDEIDQRFAGRPRVAAELHYLIGRSFARLHDYPPALAHLRRAMTLGQPLDGAGADPVLRSAAELAEIDYVQGHLKDTLARYEAVLAEAEGRIAADDEALLELRQRVALGRYRLGDWTGAAQALDRLVKYADASLPPSEFAGKTELYLGQVLTDLAKFADAEVHLRRAVEVLTSASGPMGAAVTQARAALGLALAAAGQYDAAAAQLDQALELAARAAPPDSWFALRPRYFQALLFLERDLPGKAEPILTQIVESQEASVGATGQPHADSASEPDHTGPVRQALGEAFARETKYDDAITTLELAVAVTERSDGALHPRSLSTRLSLAECLVAQGRDAEARAVLAAAALDLTALPAVHPIAAQLDRVNGLLAQHDGNMEQARKWFGNSLAILQALYGPQQWRVIRAREELQRAASS